MRASVLATVFVALAATSVDARKHRRQCKPKHQHAASAYVSGAAPSASPTVTEVPTQPSASTVPEILPQDGHPQLIASAITTATPSAPTESSASSAAPADPSAAPSDDGAAEEPATTVAPTGSDAAPNPTEGATESGAETAPLVTESPTAEPTESTIPEATATETPSAEPTTTAGPTVSAPTESAPTESAPTESAAPTETPTSTESAAPTATETAAPSGTTNSAGEVWPSVSQPGATTPDNMQQSILDLHNQIRALHGAPALVWDNELAEFAAGHSDACAMTHSASPPRTGGENLAAKTDPTLGELFGMWAAEGDSYDWANPGFTGINGATVGHWTQIVWKSTQKLGCAWKTCPDGSIFSGYGDIGFLVCEYFPAGNQISADPNETKTIFNENISPVQ